SAGAALQGSSVEIAIATLDHTGLGICAVAVAPGEGVQNSLGAARRDLEDCAKAVGAAEIGRSIQVAVAALDQSGIGSLTVTAAFGEGVQNRLGATRRDLEDRAVVVGAAGSGRSVEVAIGTLDQTGIGIAAARGEGEQNAFGAARRDLED